MHLLFTIPDFWPHVRRGAERLVHDVGVEMIKRGHRVTVVTRTPAGPASRATIDGLDVIYRRSRDALARRAGLDPMEGFGFQAALVPLVRRADVYASHYPTDAAGLYAGGRITRRPVAVNILGWPDRAWMESRFHRSIGWITRALRNAPVTVLSDGAARQMRDEFGIDARVLHPGTFTAQWELPRQKQDRRTIVCSAAVDDPRKRIGVLVRAFCQVAASEPDLELLLVGPGDGAAHVADARAIDASIAERITLRPQTRPDELPQILSRCTVGALTSVREAFGLVVVEYLASGMPAVGCDDAGATEIITPETGALFPTDDVEGCADAIRRALKLAGDPGSVERCRERARRFDWSRAGDAHEAFYKEVAGS